MRSLFDTSKDGIVLRVHVQPGAGRETVVGVHGDALKLRVVAPPVSGRANEAVLALLSSEFGVDSSALELTSGTTSRLKRVRFTGIEPEDFEKRLEVVLAKARSAGRIAKR